MEEDHPVVISGASTTPLPGLGDRIRGERKSYIHFRPNLNGLAVPDGQWWPDTLYAGGPGAKYFPKALKLLVIGGVPGTFRQVADSSEERLIQGAC